MYGNNTRTLDAYGYSLNYFNNDYKKISANSVAEPPFATIGSNLPTNDIANPQHAFTAKQLFNGNIGSMVVSIPKIGETMVYGYNYDQLNRLTGMYAYNGISHNEFPSQTQALPQYRENISYDANGNILTYKRNGDHNTGEGPVNFGMDDLTYQYEKDAAGKKVSNKLRYVHDLMNDNNYPEDIDSQTSLSQQNVQQDYNTSQTDDNYEYDLIGNLIKDTKEHIKNIDWTVYGKISRIEKDNGTIITYTYDASGNRITKQTDEKEITYYVRDASGNVMSIYKTDGYRTFQNEVHLYGSSRLGIYNINRDVSNLQPIEHEATISTFARGNKFFELSNHLGNVLVTVSDRKLAVDNNNDFVVDYYNADVVTANDYYPFGMIMPGRKFIAAGSGYRYGFNGKELDNSTGEGNLDFGARIMDVRVGKFLSIDPMQKKYPSLTPYNFVSNSPLIMVDLDGRDLVYFNSKGKEIFREKNDKEFRAFVETGTIIFHDKLYRGRFFDEAPMPKIIRAKGAESKTAPINQRLDYIIAAETFIFNKEKREGIIPKKGKSGNSVIVNPRTVPDLDPTLVKATVMQESDMGLGASRKNNDLTTDVMQANVCYDATKPTNSKLCDWGGGFKEQFGLKLGEGTSPPQQSINAGIRIMFLKGVNEDGQGGGTWSGGTNWENACMKYNGDGVNNYDRVVTMQQEAIIPLPENYVASPTPAPKPPKKK